MWGIIENGSAATRTPRFVKRWVMGPLGRNWQAVVIQGLIGAMYAAVVGLVLLEVAGLRQEAPV